MACRRGWAGYVIDDRGDDVVDHIGSVCLRTARFTIPLVEIQGFSLALVSSIRSLDAFFMIHNSRRIAMLTGAKGSITSWSVNVFEAHPTVAL